MAGIIGKKLGMTRLFDDNGRAVPATLVEAGPCYITQIKTQEKDGYRAIQMAFEDKKPKNTSRPVAGHFEKAGVGPKRYLREFKSFDTADELNLGDEIKVDSFSDGEKVTITGISRGKGFQGVMKRHGFGGGPKTHGQSDRPRAPGSIGQSSSPSKVFKGMKMGGRTGNDQVTLKKRRILKIVPEQNLIVIEGTIPGSKSSLILIKN